MKRKVGWLVLIGFALTVVLSPDVIFPKGLAAQAPISAPRNPPATPTPPPAPPPLAQDIMPFEPAHAVEPLSPSNYRVVPIYFVPKNVPPDARYLALINQRMQWVQAWYGWQMRDRTFTLDPAVTVIGNHDLDWFYEAPNPSDWPMAVWNHVFTDLADLGYRSTSNRVWGVFFHHTGKGAPALGAGSGYGGGQFLVAIDRLVDDCRGKDCRANVSDGAVAHELGHAFGLPHPQDEPDVGHSVMSWGFYGFPETSLLNSSLNPERNTLRNNPMLNQPLGLLNPSFEDCLDRWTVSPPKSLTCPETRHSGVLALQLASTASGAYRIYQDVAISGGIPYDFSVWVRLSGSYVVFNSAHYSIRLEVYNSTGQLLTSEVLDRSGACCQTWVHLGKAIAMPAQAVRARVVIDVQSLSESAVILLDDLLFQLSPGTPPQPFAIFHSTQMPFNTSRPTLNWDDAAWPTSYRVQVADNPQFNQPVVGAITQWPWHNVPTDLRWDVPYHWRIQAQNGSGVSPWLYAGQFIAQSGSTYQSDEFDTGSLNPAWSWVREDPTHWGWAGPGYTRYLGELRISLQPGSLDGPANNARNILVRQNPGTHVAFNTRLRFDWGFPQNNTEQAGLIVYQNDDNFIKLVRSYQNGDAVELGLERNGQATWYSTPARETTLYLKIERYGTSYQGYLSVDGFIWYPVGPTISVPWSSPRVGLIAYAGQSTSQYDALFDWWRAVDLDVLPLCYDFDGNGQTDGTEIRDFTTRWRQAVMLPYDTNGDGKVTILDIMHIAATWGVNCATSVMPIATPTITPTPAPPQNLVQNPSFEDGVYAPDKKPSYWTTDAWRSGSTFVWDNAQAHSGNKSVHIDSPIANDVRWIQAVPVSPNTRYILSGWIKTNNVAHAEGAVVAGANLGLFGTWDHTPGLFGTNDWTFVSMEFNSGSNTSVTVACRLGYWSGTATGTTWCDDISLKPASGIQN